MKYPTRSVFLTALATVWTMAADPCAAQCTTGWQQGFSPLPGASAVVRASTTWDPDGAGPLPASLVIAGDFSFVGNLTTNALAVQDLASGGWSTLGTGMNGPIHALAAMPNGDLVAGGSFSTANGAPAANVARWNGTSWSSLGAGTNGLVTCLAVLANGDLVAGGTFATAGGSAAANIARWNGTNWSPLGTGTDDSVRALVVMPNGALVAGGHFTTAGGGTASRVATWNGSVWSPLAGGASAPIYALALLSNGDLISGGAGYQQAFSTFYLVRRWDGIAWTSIGSFNNEIYSLVLLPNGNLVAGGTFGWEWSSFSGSPGLVQWNGATWSGLGSGLTAPSPFPQPNALTLAVLPSGDLTVGGTFGAAGGVIALNLARWNGTNWSSVGAGFNGAVFAASKRPNGNLVVGGQFTTAAGGVGANGIVQWNGATWSALGSGIAPTNGAQNPVFALTSLANGDVIAGGIFTSAGGVAANNIARWDGTAWSALGIGVDGPVRATVRMPNGELVVGGAFVTAGGVGAANIARWNGVSWSPLGTGLNSGVGALAVAPNGDLIAVGSFSIAGGVSASRVARWNGTTWSAVGAGLDPLGIAYSVAIALNGDLFVGGFFTTAGGVGAANIARWDGSAWTPLGSGVFGEVRSLAVMPNGDLLVGGTFLQAGGVPADRIARWNGSAWGSAGSMNGILHSLIADAQGIPFAGGEFTNAAPGVASAHVARMTTNCVATSAMFGSGCPSSGGSNTLVATTQPWVDSTFVATGTGLPMNAILISATSFLPIVPGFALNQLFPQSPSGCALLVAPDICFGLVTATGTVESRLFLPNVPPLVGLTFYHQLIPFDVAGPITATNGLQLTAGLL